MADDIEGKTPHVAGKAKSGIGEPREDAKLEREGELDQTERPVEQSREADEAAMRRAAARQSKEHQF